MIPLPSLQSMHFAVMSKKQAQPVSMRRGGSLKYSGKMRPAFIEHMRRAEIRNAPDRPIARHGIVPFISEARKAKKAKSMAPRMRPANKEALRRVKFTVGIFMDEFGNITDITKNTI